MQSHTLSIFSCYAQKDNNESLPPEKRWLERLSEHLEPLELQQQLSVWSDKEIEIGEDWNQQIGVALQEAKVAILLVECGVDKATIN